MIVEKCTGDDDTNEVDAVEVEDQAVHVDDLCDEAV